MLRFRLFVGFLPVLLILLAVGWYATQLVSGVLGDTVFLSSYRSAQAAQKMREAVSQMDRGIQFALDGESDTGLLIFEHNLQNFKREIAAQRKSPTSPEEHQMIEEMAVSFEAYRSAGESILALTNHAEQQQAYGGQFAPRQVILSGLAERIRQLNDSAMVRAQEKVVLSRSNYMKFMGSALVAALLLAMYAAYQSAQRILEPIKSLTRSAIEMGQGNLDQRVPVVSNDELGDLANAFNRMARQLRSADERLSERIMRLHHSREATLATFPDPVFVLDSDGRVELTNPAADELARRLGLGDNLPPALVPRVARALKDGDNYLPAQFKDALAFRSQGGERYYLPRVLAMTSPTGTTIGVAVVLIDITRFRLIDEVKTDMIATVSHEVKTPLTSIVMVLHLLADQSIGPLTDKQAEQVSTACGEAERLQRILGDLLDMARLENEPAELRLESVTAEELVDKAVREHNEVMTTRGFRLAVEVEPGLPPVRVDLQRIGHVFANFISNAAKHSPAGGRITLRARRNAAGAVRFSVADEGPGIPIEYQSRIFDKFFRVPGQQKSGAGLGLSIAREIVTAHHGRIGVETAPGGGSEFYAELRPA